MLLDVGGPPDSDRRVSLFYREARLALARKEPDRAMALIERARASSPSVEFSWQLDVEAGRAGEERGDFAAAERSYHQAISIIEATRSELAADDFKAALLAVKREPYERLFALRAAAGRGRDAVAAAELMLARVFLDAFVGSRSTSSEPPKEAELLDRADALRSLLPALRASPVATPRPIDEVLRAVRGDYVLEWIAARDAIWLIRIDRGNPMVQRLHTTSGDLAALAGRWLRNPDDAAVAGALATAILPPGALPSRGRDLFVVASGPLARLPISALRVGQRRLIEDYVVHYVPSLSALVAICSIVRPANGAGLAFVDPRGDLPWTRVEAEAAAATGVRVIAGDQATSGAAAGGSARPASALRHSRRIRGARRVARARRWNSTRG